MTKHDALYSLFGQTKCVLKQMVFVEEAEHLNNCCCCCSQISSDCEAHHHTGEPAPLFQQSHNFMCVFSTGIWGSMDEVKRDLTLFFPPGFSSDWTWNIKCATWFCLLGIFVMAFLWLFLLIRGNVWTLSHVSITYVYFQVFVHDCKKF